MLPSTQISVAATRLEVGLIAVVGRFHNRLSRLNRGNRSAPVVATRLESQLRVDQSWTCLPNSRAAALPAPQHSSSRLFLPRTRNPLTWPRAQMQRQWESYAFRSPTV